MEYRCIRFKSLLIGVVLFMAATMLFFTGIFSGEAADDGTDMDIASVPSAEEFLKMDCKYLEHVFPEFPSVEVADAWNVRMHECMDEQGMLQFEVKVADVDGESAFEMDKLRQMSCDEIIQRNTEGNYLDGDNRAFAREKVLDCSDEEESFAAHASCEELYNRYHNGSEYWFEDHKMMTENRLAKCPGILNIED